MYRHIYNRICACHGKSRAKHKPLLLDVYRAMLRGNELDPYNKSECFDYAMLAFHALDIKLNERLYPENPNDTRTLVYLSHGFRKA